MTTVYRFFLLLTAPFIIVNCTSELEKQAKSSIDDSEIEEICNSYQIKIDNFYSAILGSTIPGNSTNRQINKLAKRVKVSFEKIQEQDLTQIDTLIEINNKIRGFYGRGYEYSIDVITEQEILELEKIKGSQLKKFRLNQFEEKFARNLYKIVSMPPFCINKVAVEVFPLESVDDSLRFQVVPLFYDSTARGEIKYWINDSSGNETNAITQFGLPIIKLKEEKGKHRINGQIRIYGNPKHVWKPWELEYEVE